MSPLLEKAMQEVYKLPAEEQEAIGAWLLEELESDRRWDRSLEQSSSVLDQMAREAREEYRRGETLPLDPDKL